MSSFDLNTVLVALVQLPRGSFLRAAPSPRCGVFGPLPALYYRRVLGPVRGAPMVGNKHPAATEEASDEPCDERALKSARMDATVKAPPSASPHHAVPPQLRQHAAQMLASALAAQTSATQPPLDVAHRVRTTPSQRAPGHRNRPSRPHAALTPLAHARLLHPLEWMDPSGGGRARGVRHQPRHQGILSESRQR